MRRIRILFEVPSAILAALSCRGGGTGRRAGFKIRFLCGSAGSIPALGTMREFPSRIYSHLFATFLAIFQHLTAPQTASSYDLIYQFIRICTLFHNPDYPKISPVGVIGNVWGNFSATFNGWLTLAKGN